MMIEEKVIESQVRYWSVVPCAGIGLRMDAQMPKQYLKIANKTLIEHTLNTLLKFSSFKKIVVVVSEEDTCWKTLEILRHPNVIVTIGGEERFHSVLNGLEVLLRNTDIADNDWVVVHDAVRPCLRLSDFHKLVARVIDYDVGGLLGVPVTDTLKRTINQDAVVETLKRNTLWHALTPQMFRFCILMDSMKQALEDRVVITDESSAVEYAGYQPVIVEGHNDNIKVTGVGDLQLASFYIAQQLEMNKEVL